MPGLVPVGSAEREEGGDQAKHEGDIALVKRDERLPTNEANGCP